MSTKTTRQAPPPLIMRCPDCPICGEETRAEDGYYCEVCDVSWDYETGERGEWTEPDAAQCTSGVQPHKDADPVRYPNLIDLRYRCVLAEGHEHKHRHPDMWPGWDDKHAHAYRVEVSR